MTQTVLGALDRVATLADLTALISTLGYYSVPMPAANVKQLARQLQAATNTSPSLAARPLLFERTDGAASGSIKLLFCSGVARSGTTALGKLLNLADEVAIFTELYNPYMGYSPDLFGQEALHSDYFSRKPHVRHDILIRNKLESGAIYTGDKRPLFLNSWELTRSNIAPSELRIINILREPNDVIRSYCKRTESARQLRDSWSPDRNQLSAELDLAEQLRAIEAVRSSQYRDSLLLVRYPEILVNTDEQLRIFDFLEITVTAFLKARLEAVTSENRFYLEKNAQRAMTESPFLHLDEEHINWYRSHL